MTSFFLTSRPVGGGNTTYNYRVIPEGNYDGAQLAAVVHANMGSAYTVSYDDNNLSLKVSSDTLEFQFVLPSENVFFPTLKDQ